MTNTPANNKEKEDAVINLPADAHKDNNKDEAAKAAPESKDKK